MHYPETNETETLLNSAREQLLATMPEVIEVFDAEDATYFVYSEFADYIIKNIGNEETLKKATGFISLMLESESEVIETLIVIEVFQKIYSKQEILYRFRDSLNGRTEIIFDNYFMEYNRPPVDRELSK